MTRDELLAALLVERYNGGGWKTPERAPEPDDEVTCKRRQRHLLSAVKDVVISEEEVDTA